MARDNKKQRPVNKNDDTEFALDREDQDVLDNLDTDDVDNRADDNNL